MQRAAFGAESTGARPGAAVAAGVGREWCHTYDLTRPAGDAALQGGLLALEECTDPGAYATADRLAGDFLSSLPAPDAGLLSPGCAARLPHLADTVLALDSLADDSQLHRLLPDPASAVALLSVRKLCCAGMIGPRMPDGQLHVLRHKRRRLGLSVVEVDPDAEERAADAAARAAEVYNAGAGPSSGVVGMADVSGAGRAGKAGKSTAAVLCGGPPSGSKALDF
ncbi:hypothetical protein GPECTOR_70g531 [Gonium pectorale]|uniref:Elongator complex protein 4 n=1 Tax=Gonium pectorale TaxID=33097 RepID=A0A150G4R3_GONPE|nr:hypothetical protein GPECTOR_70g531 [Gonium pectorale]|eukprot:KXZ44300.1 hypothetical protein GPECTOR_70g531 [Gonium pectorale]